MADLESVGSTVRFFLEAGAGERAKMLDRKLDDLELSAKTAVNQIEQIRRQLVSPRQMVQILASEAIEPPDLLADVRQALAELHAIELDDPQELYGRRVDRAIQILEGLCQSGR